MRTKFENFSPSNILRLTIECQDKNGDNYKVYINGVFHTDMSASGFVPDQYKLDMTGTTAEWFTLEFRYAHKHRV